MSKDKRAPKGHSTPKVGQKGQRYISEFKMVTTLSEYTWEIKDFSSICPRACRNELYTKIESDEFLARDVHGIESSWRLNLVRHNSQGLTLFLSHVGKNGRSVKMDYCINLGNDDDPNALLLDGWSRVYKDYKPGDNAMINVVTANWLYHQRRTLLKNDTLRITVKIELITLQNCVNLNVKVVETSLHSALSKDFAPLFNDQESSDVTIVCGDKTFYVHRLILSARSPVFKAMFSSGLSEARTGRVVLEDMDEDAAESILRYIYTGEVRLPESKSISYFDLIPGAEKYFLTELKTCCFEKLLEDVAPNKVLRILETMDMFGASEEMKTVVKEHCRRNLEVLLTDPYLKAKYCENPSIFG